MTLNTSRLIRDALTRDADRRRALATRLATKADSHDDAAAVVDLLKEAAVIDAVARYYEIDLAAESASDLEPERSTPAAAPAKHEPGAAINPGTTVHDLLAAATFGRYPERATRPVPAAHDADPTTVVDEHGTPTDPLTLTERRRSIDPAEALAQRAKETTP